MVTGAASWAHVLLGLGKLGGTRLLGFRGAVDPEARPHLHPLLSLLGEAADTAAPSSSKERAASDWGNRLQEGVVKARYGTELEDLGSRAPSAPQGP